MKQFYYTFLILTIAIITSINTSTFAEDMIMSGPVESGVYESTGDIISQDSCTVDPGIDAICIAYYNVRLTTGFHAKAGSAFNAKITDDDGLPNIWEMNHFGNLDANPNDDPDGDLLTNLHEYQLGTDPNVFDLDTDLVGLPDWWEMQFFGLLDWGPNDDPDSDQLTNMEEYEIESDPTVRITDNDSDGMPDRWEIDKFGSIAQGRADDFDGDGIDNFVEYKFETDPTDPGDRPNPGIYYTYDPLGRIKEIFRIPAR